MARQNSKELSYQRHRQGQVRVDFYGRCCGSIGANKLASLGRSSTSAFYDFVQMYVHHVQMCVQTRRLAHGPFQVAVH